MKYPNPAPKQNPKHPDLDSGTATHLNRSQPEPARSASTKNGFDPYNSGAFDRRKTWEKVLRK